MTRQFKTAVNVSPFIRFGRWNFLLLGIIYGATRQSYLQNKEDKTKIKRLKVKTENNAKISAAKKKISDEQIRDLEVIFNSPK